jgi:hypothetical protein
VARLPRPDTLGRHREWKLGSIYQALLTGLAPQWLADPEHSLSGHDLAAALRTLTAHVEPQDHTAASHRS